MFAGIVVCSMEEEVLVRESTLELVAGGVCWPNECGSFSILDESLDEQRSRLA